MNAWKLMKLYAPWYNLVLIRFWCISVKQFRCCPKFMISLTQCYRVKLRAIVPNMNYFKKIILKFKIFVYNSNSNKIICIFSIYGDNNPLDTQSNPLGEKFFTIGVFRKNASKYAKLMIESYISDNLSEICQFFSILTKKKLKFMYLKNHLKGNRLISFVHVWLCFAGIKIFHSFFLICYNLYMAHASRKEWGDCHTNLIFSFLIIYITTLLFRRKFCDVTLY